jgi:hypothetical protein
MDPNKLSKKTWDDNIGYNTCDEDDNIGYNTCDDLHRK